ncbi:MAG: sulfotransferase family 2 domain-containing protein, partial [Gammaproteobacteria bacterium]
FVRNPWDRLFSAYNFLKAGGMNKGDRKWAESNIAIYKTFEDFVKTGLQEINIRQWKHIRAQSNFLFVPLNRKLQVNFLGYYENIQADFQYVANRLGLSNTVLMHENSSNSSEKLDYRHFYTEETRNIVSQVYENDIKTFGYNFDNTSLKTQLQSRL